jgi:outer membrane lipoprotein carrier protein
MLLWSSALGFWNFSLRAVDTSPIVSDWLKAQTNIHTWSADFTQTKALKSLAQPLKATGRVWFEAPNRFRWELGHPAQTIAVREPEQMLVIYPRLKLAERYPLTGQVGQWRDIMSLLDAGFPRSQADLESEYNILGQRQNDGVCEITLQPKSGAARKMMPQIKIGFSTKDFSLRSTELEFADGSTLRNDFHNPELNPTVDESLFAPKLESDYKISEPMNQK